MNAEPALNPSRYPTGDRVHINHAFEIAAVDHATGQVI
jgi:hypothetical protein